MGRGVKQKKIKILSKYHGDRRPDSLGSKPSGLSKTKRVLKIKVERKEGALARHTATAAAVRRNSGEEQEDHA